jgi:hypothetical protein
MLCFAIPTVPSNRIRCAKSTEPVGACLTGVKIFSGRPRPRAVEPRGDLSDIERSTVKMFEQVSPSIARVAGRQGGGGPQMTDEATPAKPTVK